MRAQTTHDRRRSLRAGGLLALAVAAAVAAPGALATAPGDNGQIAFRRFFDSAHRSGAIFLINPDGSGERQVSHPPRGAIDAQFGPPSFAPDGTSLIFTRSVAGSDSIWRVNADGTGEKRLSPKPRFAHPRGHQVNQQNGNGVYSPDGRRIAFARADPPLRRNNLKVSLDTMAADGTHVRRLVNLGYHGDLGRLAWSPDGTRIVYEATRYGRKPAHALFVIAARGGRPHRISPWRQAEFNTLDWSPDGARLLISLLPLGSDFGGDYYTIRPDGRGLRRLTHFGPKATTGAARWSPDGTSIVFANAGVGGTDDIYVMHADGSAITAVTHTPTWESAPAWGPAR
jgi:Tol biopolymer transport system component